MRLSSTAASLFLTACALSIIGCATPRKPAPAAPPVVAPDVRFTSHWNGEGLTGPPSIKVKLGEQRAYFYRGASLAGVSKISTGRRGFETPAGVYKITQKDRHHVSNLYGDYVDAEGNVVKRNVDVTKESAPPDAVFRGAMMPYFLRFYRGYGMHAGRVPGYRASHGCVRLPSFMAKHFYENAALGTPVVVEE